MLGGSVGRDGCQLLDSRGQTTVVVQYGSDDRHDTEEHDDALYEVVHGRGLVAAENDIDGGQNGHDDHAILVGNIEAHLEQTRNAAIDTSGVGDEEYEGNDRGSYTQALIGKAGSEEVGHGARLDVLRHELGALAEDNPRQQRTDDGIADTNPGRRQTIFPTKLSGIAYEDHCREITRSEGESREPGAYGASAQYKSIDTAGLLAGIETHANHHGQENDGK